MGSHGKDGDPMGIPRNSTQDHHFYKWGSCTAGADGALYLVLCNVRQVVFLGVHSACSWEDLDLLQWGAIGWSQKGLSKGKQHFHTFKGLQNIFFL